MLHSFLRVCPEVLLGAAHINLRYWGVSESDAQQFIAEPIQKDMRKPGTMAGLSKFGGPKVNHFGY